MYTENAINWHLSGHSGYNGGGDVAAVLGSPDPVLATAFTSGISGAPGNSSSSYYFVTLMGTHDATTALGATPAATILPYNGVTLPYTGGGSGTWTFSSIMSGTYSAWNLEHLYYLTSGTGTTAPVSGESQTAADNLANAIYNTSTAGLGGVGVKITDVFCSRSTTAGSEISSGTLP